MRLRLSTLTLVAVAALCAPAFAVAADPGDLDRSFSDDGIRYVDFGRFSTATDVFVHTDEQLTLVGDIGTSTPYKLGLARLSPNGALDSTFGQGGRVVEDPSSGYDYSLGWGFTTTGKAVVLGRRGQGYYLIRFNEDGSRDTSFGNAGMATGMFPQDWDRADLLVLPSGRLIISTTRSSGTNVITAHSAKGRRLMNFGDNGSVSIAMDDSGRLAFDPTHSRILVPGVRNDRRLVVGALTVDGDHDKSFGLNAIGSVVIPTVGHEWVGPPAIGVIDEGDVALAASVWDSGSSTSDVIVVQLSADGSPKTGDNGRAWRRYDIDAIDAPVAVVPLPSGKLVVAGWLSPGLFDEIGDGGFFTLGLRSGGSKWLAFGRNGIRKVPLADAVAFDATLTDRGLVIVGLAKSDFVAIRMTLN